MFYILNINIYIYLALYIKHIECFFEGDGFMGIIFLVTFSIITIIGFIVAKKKNLKTKSIYIPIITLSINLFIHRNNFDFYLTEPFTAYIGAFIFTILTILNMWFEIFFEIKHNE